MMNEGIYEALVTQLVAEKLKDIDKAKYFIKEVPVDKEEAAGILSVHLAQTFKLALNQLKPQKGHSTVEIQIQFANKIISLLRDELKKEEFDDDLIETEGKILKAVFSKVDAHFSDAEIFLKEITPYTRLTQSELFTGGNLNLSLESELRKEILSSDRIDLLVSFIKFKGVIILKKELEDFTRRGGQLRVVTTTYMGASDYKAIRLLSELPNTEVKISYNTGNERLHAKAYLFYRNTGFHTGYIGSSNFSRSALTDGLEWNLKITTTEVSHIIDKFQKTFDGYWENNDFEVFDPLVHTEKLISSLKKGKHTGMELPNLAQFDIKPYPFQAEILEKLEVERTVHHRKKNLVVAATGTGKTVISAFDYKRFKQSNTSARLLFLAHRKEILTQALATFRGVLKDNNFGELFVDGWMPDTCEHIFASVQSMRNRHKNLNLSPDYFDYIVIDECHHQKAKSYRGLLNYFEPAVLLGLTATPERMDGGDIREDFCNRIAAEIRLPEALNQKLLCPFQYFGISDSIDLSHIGWEKGRYIAQELTKVYTANDRRVGDIIAGLDQYTKDLNEVRALGFCASIEHARFMAQKFSLAGLKAGYLTSANANDREALRKKLQKREINYLFVVDIFNEGVDLPEIDTVLFLRPTESLTIFLQQLGRGLRLAEGKDSLTVLDFVGNARPEYNFENKFRALVGRTKTTIEKELKADFPHLPLGCSIVLEKKAKESILKNIVAVTRFNRNQLIHKIRNWDHNTTLALTLKNFVEFTGTPIQEIYKRSCWSRLCHEAGKLSNFEKTNEKELLSAIRNKWLATQSTSYFEFILKLARQEFNISVDAFSLVEKSMLLMLYYDVWQKAAQFDTLEKGIRALGKNKTLVAEIIELVEILTDQIDFKEVDIALPYPQPLKVHSRYTRDQILTAFGLSNFERKSSNREGVAENSELNTELLFIDLIKTDEDFSPTTMYDDYAVNAHIFHWQSQNLTGPGTPKGQSYIHHQKNQKHILLFVREKRQDEFGQTMGYVFIGEGIYRDSYGSKPMSINWQLKTPLPHYLWKDAAKLAVG